jgi:hypothetical protein
VESHAKVHVRLGTHEVISKRGEELLTIWCLLLAVTMTRSHKSPLKFDPFFKIMQTAEVRSLALFVT